MSGTTAPSTYTVDEAAALLGVNRLTIYNAVKRNDAPFPVVRIGDRVLIPRAALDRILAGEPEPVQ